MADASGGTTEVWDIVSLDRVSDPQRPICYGIVQVGAFANGGVPVLAIKNLSGDYSTNINRCSAEVEKSYARSRVRPGDVLISVKGSVGKIGLVPAHYSGNISRDLARLCLTEADEPGYWFQALQCDDAQRRLGAATVGTTRLELSIAVLKEFTMPRPRRREQHAIAGALGDVDALLNSLDRLIAKKRHLKQAVTQQLLSGQTRLPGFHGPWSEQRMGECLLVGPRYGINAAAVAFSDRFPTYLRITDISADGRFRPDPPVSVAAPHVDQYYLADGDLVFARTGASVGKSYRYRPEDGLLVFAGFLIRVRSNPEVLRSDFLAAYATTPRYWNWVRVMSMRSGQPGINGNEYAQLPLLIPPPDEQLAIAEALANMEAELLALEQRRDKTCALKQGMMQELLTGRIRLV
jgi:type I restriction enzyme, S subunit